jgi:adenylate cyclase class IV
MGLQSPWCTAADDGHPIPTYTGRDLQMAANIEIKAKVRDPERLRSLAEALSDTMARVLSQRDVFFCTPHGRLKLRVLAPNDAYLVYYERADATGPRRSDYYVSSTPDPVSLEHILSAALGIRGEVRKVRTLYMVGQTRIHLDEVEGLGHFVELEAVLGPHQTAQQGRAMVDELMEKLDIREQDLIDVAYIDLLERR